MLISHSKKFIFIHIYKTAGTSLTKMLLKYSRFKDFIYYGIPGYKYIFKKLLQLNSSNKNLEEYITGFKTHSTALEVQEKLPSKTFDEYYKFAFVRNPYDWLGSLYFYVCRNPIIPKSKILRKMTFLEFVNDFIDKKPGKQIDFVTDKNGKIIVDFVGKIENLEKDVKLVTRHLGIDFKNIPKKNTFKSRPNNNYLLHYDEESLIKVAEYFSEDFEKFDYKKLY